MNHYATRGIDKSTTQHNPHRQGRREHFIVAERSESLHFTSDLVYLSLKTARHGHPHAQVFMRLVRRYIFERDSVQGNTVCGDRLAKEKSMGAM
jgi:hypothetical protein